MPVWLDPTGMLVLKLTLVPLLIAGVTMIGRRWGARAAGMFGAMPVVAGPIAVFLAIEQGPGFAAHAAVGAIAAIVALLAYFVAYTWSSHRLHWPAALGSALLAWSIAGLALTGLPFRIDVAIAAALLALLAAPWLMPADAGFRPPPPAPRFDLPIRMLAGAALTVAVTAAATRVGEAWSGLLTAFPVITIVLGVFTHRDAGPDQVGQLFRGMILGLYGFGAFFATLATLLPRVGLAPACAAAIVAALVAQTLVRRLAARR
jgi:uncharacterized membrane protein (GlpM family)